MRKMMFRITTGGFGIACLTLCAAAVALWMRSTAEMDQVRTADPYRQTTLVSANGEFCVETISAVVPEFDPGLNVAHALPSQYGPRSLNWQFAGLGSGEVTEPSLTGPLHYHTLMIPLWMIVVLLAIPPVLIWDARSSASAKGAATA